MNVTDVDPGSEAVLSASRRSSAKLVAEQVGFAFTDSEVVLDGVDLSIGVGERVALMGPSGSGKSTLLHILSGVLTPSCGRVLFDGACISELDRDARARIRLEQFGFVFQFSELLPDLTLRENVELPLWLLGGKGGADRPAALLDSLGIGHVADKLPSRVSGGERQRAAIARALVHRPSVVFADEPTGALDVTTGAVVMDALLDLTRSDGTSLLVVTHNPDVAGSLDRIVSIDDGRVAG